MQAAANPLNQGKFGTCCGYSFAQSLCHGMLWGAGVAINLCSEGLNKSTFRSLQCHIRQLEYVRLSPDAGVAARDAWVAGRARGRRGRRLRCPVWDRERQEIHG